MLLPKYVWTNKVHGAEYVNILKKEPQIKKPNSEILNSPYTSYFFTINEIDTPLKMLQKIQAISGKVWCHPNMIFELTTLMDLYNDKCSNTKIKIKNNRYDN